MHFLIAIDGSEQSEVALEYAISLTNPATDTLTVATAVNPDVYSEGGIEPITKLSEAEQRLIVENIETAEKRAEETLSRVSDRISGTEITFDTITLYGNPVRELTDYADENTVDGIFVGHRGLSDRVERVVGSVAKGVVERARVPVTVVK